MATGNAGLPCTANDQCASGLCGPAGSGKHCCSAACNTTTPCGATDCDTSGTCAYAAAGTACTAGACDGSGTCKKCGLATSKCVFVRRRGCVLPDRGDGGRLGGTFRAWLSAGTDDPATRLTHASVPYVRIDGVMFTPSWSALTTGGALTTLSVTETGASLPSASVWTNTSYDGTEKYSQGSSMWCDGWNSNSSTSPYSRTGSTANGGYSWTDTGFDLTCDHTLPLYCFEQ
jgi:hypothetical protein